MLCLLEQYTPLKSHSIVWWGMPFWITLYISGVSHVVSVTWRIKPSPYPETGWNICFDKFNMWEQELGPWNNLDLELFGGFSQCGVCFYLKNTHILEIRSTVFVFSTKYWTSALYISSNHFKSDPEMRSGEEGTRFSKFENLVGNLLNCLSTISFYSCTILPNLCI